MDDLEKAHRDLIQQSIKTKLALDEADAAQQLMENNDATLLKIVGDMGELKGQVTEGFRSMTQQFTVQNGRTGKLEGKVDVMKGDMDNLGSRVVALETNDGKEQSAAEKRKDWIWGAVEKIIFMLIIPGIGLVLIKLGILNITTF